MEKKADNRQDQGEAVKSKIDQGISILTSLSGIIIQKLISCMMSHPTINHHFHINQLCCKRVSHTTILAMLLPPSISTFLQSLQLQLSPNSLKVQEMVEEPLTIVKARMCLPLRITHLFV